MSQLLLVRTPASSSLTSLVFAIFSSIEKGSSSPKGDSRRWLFVPDAGSGSFQRRPLERVGRIPPFLLARNQSASNAAARGAIHARECQSPFSCPLGWRLATCLYAFHSKLISAVNRVSSGSLAIWPQTPRCDDRGKADAPRRNEPCSCGRFSPECRRPDSISDRTTESLPEHRRFSAARRLHPIDREMQMEGAVEAAIAFRRRRKSHSSKRAPALAQAGCPRGISSIYIRS